MGEISPDTMDKGATGIDRCEGLHEERDETPVRLRARPQKRNPRRSGGSFLAIRN